MLHKDVLPRWAGRKAKDISRRDVVTLLNSIVDRGAPIQANRTLTILRRMFGFAVGQSIIETSPCDKVEAPSPENHRDRALSEDLVQEVFLRILKYRQSYRPGTPFRAWVYQIARNTRIDHFRKFPPQTALEPEMLPPFVPSDSAQEQQEIELLQRALQQLPEEKREILLLSRFQELKYEEIAALLGCELNTVRTRIHRALQDLREAFHQLARGTMLKKAEAAAAEKTPPRGARHEL